MKRYIKFLIGTAFCSVFFMTTSCIDETEPTSGVIQDQLDESDNAISAMLMAMPARFNELDARTGNFGDYGFGYGAMMHIRDCMTEDMAKPESGYDHFYSWECNKMRGDSYATTQYLWNFNFQSILAANKLIGSIKDTENASDFEKGAKGAAYAFRALYYLDLARCYEFLPNDKFSGTNSDGKDVTNLTVPIITEETTEEDSKNNPRATRDEMFEFIKEDLNHAEELIPYLDNLSAYKKDKTLPHLDVVYGLKARLYMWVEDYTEAYNYARMAIQESGLEPMQVTDCFIVSGGYITDKPTTNCFNDITKWMWGVTQTSENSTVKSGIINWTSWMCSQAIFGYASAGVQPCIYIPLFNRIDPYDWRQLFWDDTDAAAPGVSKKFQPNEGNLKSATVGAASSYPIMRVEEMWFIMAEAAAHSSAPAGKAILEQFMSENRMVNGSYTCTATSKEDVIEEIIFQKRIELWGEGQTFFDIKRLNYSVDRTQEGSNFQELARFKTSGRPAWMNWVIVRSEQNSNSALVGWNNPDPTDCYPAIPQD